MALRAGRRGHLGEPWGLRGEAEEGVHSCPAPSSRSCREHTHGRPEDTPSSAPWTQSWASLSPGDAQETGERHGHSGHIHRPAGVSQDVEGEPSWSFPFVGHTEITFPHSLLTWPQGRRQIKSP